MLPETASRFQIRRDVVEMRELDERMVHESFKRMIVEELADVYLGHEAEPDEEKENIERAAVDGSASGLD